MRRILGFFAVLICFCGLSLSADDHHHEKLTRYTDREYGVSFLRPTSWVKHKTESGRYEGTSGHFEIDAINDTSNSLERVIRSTVHHKLKPYGDKPRIMRRYISGRRAAVIVPSDESMRDAVLIIRSPRLIKGKYNFVAVYCDRDHIYSIARSFRLVN